MPSTKDAIAKANAALDEIGKQDLTKVTFKSTIVALRRPRITKRGSPRTEHGVIKETNTSEAMRTAAENAVKDFQDWAVGDRLSRRRLQSGQGVRRYQSETCPAKTEIVERNNARLSPRRFGPAAG